MAAAGAYLLRNIGLCSPADRVAEPRRTFAVRTDVVDDCVVLLLLRSGTYLVQPKRMSDAPGYVVVCARRIAARAKSANNPRIVIQRQPTAKHDDTAEHLPDQRVALVPRAVGSPE
jgi:hypothetical protein